MRVAPKERRASTTAGAAATAGTPYPDWNNQKIRAYLEAVGFEVLNVEGEPRAARSGNQGINDQDPEDVIAFASRVCRPEADALLCSCTAWRSLEVVGELERRTGKPVVTSNQASIWAAFRKAARTVTKTGFGRLLASPRSAVTGPR